MTEDTNVAQPLMRTKKCEEKTVRKNIENSSHPPNFKNVPLFLSCGLLVDKWSCCTWNELNRRMK